MTNISSCYTTFMLAKKVGNEGLAAAAMRVADTEDSGAGRSFQIQSGYKRLPTDRIEALADQYFALSQRERWHSFLETMAIARVAMNCPEIFISNSLPALNRFVQWPN